MAVVIVAGLFSFGNNAQALTYTFIERLPGGGPQLADIFQLDITTGNRGNLIFNMNALWTGLHMEEILPTESGTLSVNVQSFNVSPIPEPETYAMLLAGLGLVVFAARRRKTFT